MDLMGNQWNKDALMLIGCTKIAFMHESVQDTEVKIKRAEERMSKEKYERYKERKSRLMAETEKRAYELSRNLDFKVDFVVNYGRITDRDRAIQVLGEEFPVIEKPSKEVVPLSEADNMKEIYATARDYERLKRKWEL